MSQRKYKIVSLFYEKARVSNLWLFRFIETNRNSKIVEIFNNYLPIMIFVSFL